MTLDECIKKYDHMLSLNAIQHLLKPAEEMPRNHKEVYVVQFPTHIFRPTANGWHAIGSTNIVNRITFYLEIDWREENGSLNKFWKQTNRVVEFY